MKFIHGTIGILFLIVFLLTGTYMNSNFPDIYNSDQGVRMIYRSSHIYILFSSLINLLLAAQFVPDIRGWRKIIQLTGSFLFIATPFVLTLAFFIEPTLSNLERPYSLLAIVFALLATLFHSVASIRNPKS